MYKAADAQAVTSPSTYPYRKTMS